METLQKKIIKPPFQFSLQINIPISLSLSLFASVVFASPSLSSSLSSPLPLFSLLHSSPLVLSEKCPLAPPLSFSNWGQSFPSLSIYLHLILSLYFHLDFLKFHFWILYFSFHLVYFPLSIVFLRFWALISKANYLFRTSKREIFHPNSWKIPITAKSRNKAEVIIHWCVSQIMPMEYTQGKFQCIINHSCLEFDCSCVSMLVLMSWKIFDV